jgi:hypothetical protein
VRGCGKRVEGRVVGAPWGGGMARGGRTGKERGSDRHGAEMWHGLGGNDDEKHGSRGTVVGILSCGERIGSFHKKQDRKPNLYQGTGVLTLNHMV